MIIPFNCLFFIIKSKKGMIYLFIYFIILIIIFYLLYFFIYSKGTNCDDWGKGLNNTYIINYKSKYAFQIRFPKKCPYKSFYFFQDYSKIIRKNCTKLIKKNPGKIYLKYQCLPL
jgi:hypothetical protein